MKDLPPEALAEIAQFVYFVRKRALQPDTLDDEVQRALLKLQIKQWRHDEEQHLVREFEDYEQRYARE